MLCIAFGFATLLLLLLLLCLFLLLLFFFCFLPLLLLLLFFFVLAFVFAFVLLAFAFAFVFAFIFGVHQWSAWTDWGVGRIKGNGDLSKWDVWLVCCLLVCFHARACLVGWSFACFVACLVGRLLVWLLGCCLVVCSTVHVDRSGSGTYQMWST